MQAPNDVAVFQRLLVQHFELYPTAPRLSEATAPAWWDELKELPIEVLPGAFKKAREASPQFPPTATQVKTIAEVEAAYLAKARAEQRQERLFPVRELPPDEVIQAFYGACEKAEREVGAGEPTEAQVPVFRAVLVLLSRWYRLSIDDAADGRFAGYLVSDAKARSVCASELLAGIRRVPKYCIKAPTLGMVMELARGAVHLEGYASDWVAPAGDLL